MREIFVLGFAILIPKKDNCRLLSSLERGGGEGEWVVVSKLGLDSRVKVLRELPFPP